MQPKVIFIGMPGAGKSTVGRLVARRLGVAFRDSDTLVREKTGRSIAEIFATAGEKEFRRIESQAIISALTDFSGILSLGGGAILNPDTRAALQGQRVFLIDAADQVLAARVQKSRTPRPIFTTNAEAEMQKLRRERMRYYRDLATCTFFSDSRPAAFVVEKVLETLQSPQQVLSSAGVNPYEVIIGRNLQAQITAHGQKYAAALVLHSPDTAQSAEKIREALRVGAQPTALWEVPRGEAAKDISTLLQGWELAGNNHLGRDGVVISLGGGSVTDLGGFFAATWLRGVANINVPTTLLGMVDAAIGGKTAINTESGKNLVGSFTNPRGVYCDLATLDSLPHAEWKSGMGEIIKCGFIADRHILELLAAHGTNLFTSTSPALAEMVGAAIKVKLQIVDADLQEKGGRIVLNYGHTFAHALEKATSYNCRHGEAVAIGSVFAAALAELSGIAPSGFTELHRDAFAAVGLPVSYKGARKEELLTFMQVDKKVRHQQLRFVVLEDIGQPRILENPDSALLDGAFQAIGIV